jgi:hypothetical protein
MSGLLFISIVILTALALNKMLRKAPAPNYPPGPAGRFLVGNLGEMLIVKPWEAYAEWAKKYGKHVFSIQAVFTKLTR